MKQARRRKTSLLYGGIVGIVMLFARLQAPYVEGRQWKLAGV